MKTMKIIIATIVTLFAFTAQSQNIDPSLNTAKGTAGVNMVAGAFGEAIIVKNTEAAKSDNFYHKPKAVPTDLNGYLIQLETSMEKLDRANPIFEEFGNILVEENLNPKYCYLIGTFVSEEGAEKYLNEVIVSRYPNAKVVRFKEGKRI